MGSGRALKRVCSVQGPVGKKERKVWVLGGDSDSGADKKQGPPQAQGSAPPDDTALPSSPRRHTLPTARLWVSLGAGPRPSCGAQTRHSHSALSRRCGH